MKPKLVVATKNPGKLAEFQYLLPEFDLIPLSDNFEDTVEDGSTYTENAVKKAFEAYLHFNREYPVLADDSGLEVDALSGFPGLHSRRWFPGSDVKRCEMLFRLMRPEINRSARQICHLVCLHWDKDFGAVGELAGEINDIARGSNGFGYDLMFRLEDGRNLAELDPTERALHSHRAKAVLQFKEWYKLNIGGIE